MLISRHVDLPEALAAAQDEGRLVVFAGAGASMDPPSNLPSFRGLAERIGGGTPIGERERLDRYLGRLADKHVKVHEIAASILGDPTSQPNSYHSDLIQIFKHPDQVRIVTTNIDKHFTTEARRLYSERIEIHHAPSLPLGNAFSGIVYLHGSVERPADRFVLTDSDFGRAYFSDGWATSFLLKMFQRYTVLFVGYSHSDPVMTYISRSLPPDTPRFGLTPVAEADNWEEYGIKAVSYPSAGPSDHASLQESVATWRIEVQLDSASREDRIKALVEQPLPEDLVLLDLAHRAIRSATDRQFFVRHARRSDWLEWALNLDESAPLFQPAHSDDPSTQMLAHWVGSLASEHHDILLDVIRQKGGVLSPALWWTIARELAFGKLSGRPLSQWVSYLVSAPHSGSADMLTYILARLRYPEDRSSWIVLWNHLTAPYAKIKPSFMSSSDSRIEVDIAVKGELSTLQKTLDDFAKPNLDDIAQILLNQGVSSIVQAYALVDNDSGSGTFDRLSFSRSAIEPHSQDRYPESIDLIVNSVRDSLEHILSQPTSDPIATVEPLVSRRELLLRRLSVHGIAMHSTLDANVKLEWLISKGLAFTTGLKHESYVLIAKNYASSDASHRISLIDAARSSFGIAEYEFYNFAVLISRADPQCDLAKQALAEAEAINPQFKPRDHLDFHAWSSGVFSRGERSPYSAAQLRAMPENELLDLLRDFTKALGEDEDFGGFEGPSRSGLLTAFSEAVATDLSWGIGIGTKMLDRGDAKPDVVTHLLRGIARGETENAIFPTLYGFLSRLTPGATYDRDVLAVFEAHLKADLDAAWLEQIELQSRAIFDNDPSSALGDEPSKYGWLNAAINEIGGDVAQLWIQTLSQRRKATSDEDWSGIPTSHKTFFGLIATGTEAKHVYARVRLLSQFHYLHYLDPQWAKSSLLPLFDFANDPAVAQQAWAGFLFLGRLDATLVRPLLPHYEQLVKQPVSDEEDERRLADHLAGIALFTPINPLEDGWLNRVMSVASSKLRMEWTRIVGHALREMDEERRADAWKSWIRQYWSNRNLGLPTALDAQESSLLVDWVVALPEVFPEAVALLLQGPVPADDHAMPFYTLEEANITDRDSDAAAKLVEFVLRGVMVLYGCDKPENIVETLLSQGADRAILAAAADHLIRLGCPGGTDLLRKIKLA